MSYHPDAPVFPTLFVESLDSPAFTSFLESVNLSDKPLLSITLPIAGIDPLAALELNHQYEEKFYWNHPRRSVSIAAAGRLRELKATGQNRFRDITQQTETVKSEIEAYTAYHHSMAGPLFLGGYSFNDHNIGEVWKKFGGARFILPEWMLVEIGGLHLLTLIIEKNGREADEIYQEVISRITDFLNLAGELQHTEKQKHFHSNILCTLQEPEDRLAWIKKVEKARKLINAGEFEKIVLARSLSLESRCPLVNTVLAHYLREAYPDCYNFLIQKDSETSFIGATPERLASFRDGKFTTEGLAGSISRGRSAMEDASLALTLLRSQKEQAEHRYVVKAIGDSLLKFSMNIDLPHQPSVKKLQNVQHLFTPIEATIMEGVQIHELIRELHPTPAVGGFPKEKAVPYIHEIEEIDRGWYAAPVGWFNLSGDGEFAVAIRSALLHKNRAELFAGCGIIAESDPEKEWHETLLKFTPLLDALNQLHEDYV
ncbi:MAG: isochorismate synthase [Balneolaceae bacterium]|nr:MAG: isochorismate synthase [Balneolaceae bacterium]